MRLLFTVVDPRGSATAGRRRGRGPARDAAGRRPRRSARRGRPARRAAVRRGAPASDDDTLGEPPLLDGAVLTVDRPGPAEPRGLLELHVVAGPDSGAVHRLSPGEHGIGRSVEATIRIDDPDVSRLHAVLRVAADGSGDHGARPRVHQRHDRGRRARGVAPAGPFSPARCCGSATPGCAWPCPRWCPSPAGRTAPATSRSTGRRDTSDRRCRCASRCRPSRRHASAAGSRWSRSCCRWWQASPWWRSPAARPTCCSCCSRR